MPTLPRILPVVALEELAQARARELRSRAHQLATLRVSQVERANVAAMNLERAYLEGVRAGWRTAWNHLNPKGAAPDGPTS